MDALERNAEIAELRKLIGALAARLEALEGEPPESAEPAPKVDAIPPDVIVMLGAVIASYLGKKVRIRSARRIHAGGSSPWAQQGRVFVQASHMLTRHG
ncbi:MAG: hypothetical protein ACKV22_29320 [Bryobacteraceae bacterium]